MKILYIGSLQKHTNSFARFQTLKDLGNEVEGIDIDPLLFDTDWFSVRFHHFMNIGFGINKLNSLTVEKAILFKPDLIWVDNKPFLNSAALRKIHSIGGIRLINVVTDDAFGKNRDSWRIQKRTMSFYDIHFVQRKVNVAEYLKHGANKVLECDRSYNPEIHRPIELSENEKSELTCSVGFIGTYANHRAEIISKLISDNIPVSVWGSHWEEKPFWNIIKPHFRGKDVYGDEYAKILCGMKIALHFLRKENRDDQDSRTFEIPACEVFMLAERTEKHLKYFEEGKEAEYFDNYEELVRKIRFYSEHEVERKKIATAGRVRSISSDYSHRGRLKYILSEVEKLN